MKELYVRRIGSYFLLADYQQFADGLLRNQIIKVKGKFVRPVSIKTKETKESSALDLVNNLLKK
jgi:hypothetical protein